MGVHDTDKYPEVKRLLGIPEDEPIFILRAQDMLTVGVLSRYQENYRQRALTMGVVHSEIEIFCKNLENCIDEIVEWRDTHKDAVKVPD